MKRRNSDPNFPWKVDLDLIKWEQPSQYQQNRERRT